jgi:aconitate hydratase
MGVLPLCFEDGQTAQTIGLDGTEEFSILGIEAGLKPRQKLEVLAKKNGKEIKFNVVCRIDTPIEVEYYKHGGILPYVLRQIAAKA